MNVINILIKVNILNCNVNDKKVMIKDDFEVVLIRCHINKKYDVTM